MTTAAEPRAWTEEECRDMFLRHVAVLVRYWHDLPAPATRTVLDRMNGLAFSILSTIDGSSMEVPAFALTPAPHPDDAGYHRINGDNWWPDDVDIAGGLHEVWHRFQPEEGL